jgi:hypothetical protein
VIIGLSEELMRPHYEAVVPQYVLFPMLMKGKFTNKIHGRVELKQ